MTAQRKVRKDFDRTKEYSVSVIGCTKEEKEEVQQAFFDAGMIWELLGTKYAYLDAAKYTNTSDCGDTIGYIMYGDNTIRCNMTPIEFLDLVYEPEQQGHVHAELMAQYAEDAKTTDKPWELWQIKVLGSNWRNLTCNPSFATHLEYRRKPKTHTVHGVEIPDLRFKPKFDEGYWYPNASIAPLVVRVGPKSYFHSHRVANNLCYESTEAGRQAAILHAKAWLGIS